MGFFKKIFLALGFLVILGLVFLLTQEPELVSISFFLSPLSRDQSPSPSPKPFDPNELLLDLKNYLSTQSGTWGIAITPLTISHRAVAEAALARRRQSLVIDTFGLNLEKQFPAASVMKVLVAANLIHRVDKNEFSLENHAPEQSSVHGHELNSAHEPERSSVQGNPEVNSVLLQGVLVHGEVEETTLRELMKAMINRTDNEAWEVLNHFLGFENLQKFGEDLGMKNFSVFQNTISPGDVNLLLASIYQNKVASANQCQLLISLMEDTETEDRIPAAIQQEFTLRQAQGDRPSVYHKAGSWSETGTYSDAGIIESENPFILTILSENAPSQTQAIEIIQTLTAKIFVALTKQ